MKRRASGLIGATALAVALLGCGSDASGTRGEVLRDTPPTPLQLEPGQIGTVVGSGRRGTDGVDADADGMVDEPLPVLEASIDTPMDVALSADGRLFVIDWNGHKIRAVSPDGTLAFVAGTGFEGDACQATTDGKCVALATELNHPTDIEFDAAGNLWIAAWHNSKLKRLDGNGLVENVCGTGARKFEGDDGPCRDSEGVDVVSFDLPSSIALDGRGNLFVSDQANQVVRRLGVDGIVKTVAGRCPGTLGFGCPAGRGYSGDGGPSTTAQLDNSLGQGTDPQGKIAVDGQGNLYIADTGNSVVRKVTPGSDGVLGDGDPAEEIISTVAGTGVAGFAGDGGPATEALLRSPTDVAVAGDGRLYIADHGNSCIRRVETDGSISTVAGKCETPGFSGDGAPATEATLWEPYGIEVSSGALYVADTRNHRIRKVLLPN